MELYRALSCRDVEVVQVHCFEGDATRTKHRRAYSAIQAEKAQTDDKMVEAVGSSSNLWGLLDPEMQRKTRLASYKVYSVEGKLKARARRRFARFRETCRSLLDR